MGTIIINTLLSFILIVIFMVLGLFIVSDFIRTKEYINADRTMAHVNGCIGIRKTANYGRYQLPTKYYEYDVVFIVNGRTCSGTHLCKENKLKPGDTVEVRYTTGTDGTVKVVNRDIKDRFLRILICTAVAIPLCIVFIVFL